MTSATGSTVPGAVTASTAPSERPSRSTRRPEAPTRSASARSELPSGRSTSGAPSTQLPLPLKLAPLHLRADENGAVADTVQPGDSYASATAARLALGRGSAAANAPSGPLSGGSPSRSPNGS